MIDDEIDAPDAAPERQYHHIVYKAHYDDRCEGQHGNDAPAWPQGCMLDPKRITARDIAEKRAAGNYEIVYQQEDVDPASQLVRQSWIDGGLDPLDGVDYPGCWDDERPIGELPTNLVDAVRYITVDPSPTKWWSVQDWVYVPEPGGEWLTGWRHLTSAGYGCKPTNCSTGPTTSSPG